MKTTKETVDLYLQKTSEHLFVKQGENPPTSFWKLIKLKNGWVRVKFDKDLNITIGGVYTGEYYLKHWKENARCVVKHMLFLNEDYISIKHFKTINEKINKLKEMFKDVEPNNDSLALTNMLKEKIKKEGL